MVQLSFSNPRAGIVIAAATAALCATLGGVSRAQSLPQLDAKLTNLGDLDGDGLLTLNDCTVSDVVARGRNTFSFAVLDETVGWDKAYKDLSTAHPEMSHFAPIAVVEGDFMLTDPPVDRSDPSGARRIIRDSGGLRLYLVRSSKPETETQSFAGWNTETRKFQPKAGAMQTAENLAIERPAQYGFLGSLLPHPPMSVRKVKAFLGYDSRPWLVVGCSTAPDSIHPSDLTLAHDMKKPRVFRWDSPTLAFVEVPIPQFDVSVNTWGVDAGDLNEDGYPDLVLGRYKLNFFPASNKILLGKPNGTFELIQSSHDPFTIPDTTTDLEIADLDADGHLDIVVANRYRMLSDPDSTARDYILWGATPAVVPGFLKQPVLTQAWLEPDTELGRRDTVAIDVADVDKDGDLDIVAGNHGMDGGPFVEDNTLPGPPYGVPWTRNYDVIWEHRPGRVFVGADLPWTGSPQGMTTDVVFIDVVGPNRSDPPASGATSQWNFLPTLATRTGPDISSSWTGGLTDGYVDILRVGRSRGSSLLQWFLNDTKWGAPGSGAHPTFDWYHDGTGWVNLPSSSCYAWRFARLAYGANVPVLALPPSYFVGGYQVGGLDNFRGLTPSNLDGFIQTAIAADFVPDRIFGAGYLEGVHWPSAFGKANYAPDLLVGMGYELSGVPNRLYPYAAMSEVLNVQGGEYLGLLGSLGAGSASFTAGWTEYTSKGYGIVSVDIDNDADFDVIAARRTGALLYENQGNPVLGSGIEGKFEQVKDTAVWPAVDTPYAHNLFFREDACSGDFDSDGDQDVMLVGFGGTQDFNAGYTRGERDEDTSHESWLHGQSGADDRMFQTTQLLENLTVAAGGSSPGVFSHRSDRLDFNGRYTAGLGGDRGFVADLDGDGDLDMIEPCWATASPNDPAYPPYPGDPSVATASTDWANGTLNYDNIATYRALGFRYWENQYTPGAGTWLQDVAASKVRCKIPSTGATHFGPLDGRGGTDWALSTSYAKLHDRNHVSQTVADFNNDGFIDICVGYQPITGLQQNGYNMYVGDTTGVLWDATPLMPSWHADTAGPNGQARTSFCFGSNDYDQDGDVDLLVTFFFNGMDHETRLLENRINTVFPIPVNWTVPVVHFVSRPFGYDASLQPTGWVESFQKYLNWPPLADGSGVMQPNPTAVQDSVLWIGALDLDLDGDQEIATFTQNAAHRLFESKVVDSMSPRKRFVDRSSDTVYDDNSLNPVPATVDVMNTMRITSHRGALPVEFEVADYNGDGLQDIVADYNERPLAFYRNTGVLGTNAGLVLGANVGVAPIVTRVVPELGVAKGKTLRIFGKRLRNVVQVDLLFRDLSAPTVESIANGPGGTYIVAYPHGRFVDVTIPAGVASHGPFALRVKRTSSSGLIDSVPFQSSNLTLVRP